MIYVEEENLILFELIEKNWKGGVVCL